jgi:hypothetical protein
LTKILKNNNKLSDKKALKNEAVNIAILYFPKNNKEKSITTITPKVEN